MTLRCQYEQQARLNKYAQSPKDDQSQIPITISLPASDELKTTEIVIQISDKQLGLLSLLYISIGIILLSTQMNIIQKILKIQLNKDHRGERIIQVIQPVKHHTLTNS